MTEPISPPEIVAFVSDLIFYSKIENAAARGGYMLRWIESASHFGEDLPEDPHSPPGERLSGRSALLLEFLTRRHPALIIFDLSNPNIPWRQWLPLIKTAPATRRLAVVCFGSHVDVETMQMARSCGADAVLARSHFASNLPAIIQKYARIPDHAAIQSACEQGLSALAQIGLEQFNRGEYFEAHETLEAAWNKEESPGRELYRAILQVAVAYLQIRRGNYRGAMKMFLRLRQWIDPLPQHCRGVDVAQLRTDAEQVHAHLAALGEAQIEAFDFGRLKPVVYLS